MGPAGATPAVQKGHPRQDLLLQAIRNHCVLCCGQSERELWLKEDFSNNRQEAALLLQPFIKQVSIARPCSLPDLGLFLCQDWAPKPWIQPACRTEKVFCWPPQQQTAINYLELFPKPTTFCTTRSQKHFAKAVKGSCLHFRLMRLHPSVSKFTP